MLRVQGSWRLTIVATVSAVLAIGCGNSDEYEKISQAGNTYVVAVNSLLDTSAVISLNSSSERLLASDNLSNINQETYNEFSAADLAWLERLGQIRQHNQLLADYFTLLGDLATSDAPERAQTSINNVAVSLGNIGTGLRNSSDVATQLPGTVTRLVIGRQIEGALRNELEQRKDAIQQELILQEALLALLTAQISDDLEEIRILQEDRLVETSLLSNTPIAANQHDNWINTRRSILLLQTTSDKLTAAREASTKFRNLFEELVQGNLTINRINSFLSDIDEILNIIEATENEQNS